MTDDKARDIVMLSAFCSATGADRHLVGSLIESQALVGLVRRDGTACALYLDALPTSAELEANGIEVPRNYPDLPFENFVTDEWFREAGPATEDDTGPSWVITW